MEQLISKKELLEMTRISYGQLYRWKRKGLIPEDWFIKKSAYTGQETFFPRNLMLNRIAKIKSLKEDASLDDLADVFSPEFGELAMAPDKAVQRGIVSEQAMKIFLEDMQQAETLGFPELVQAYLFGRLLQSGAASLDEARQMVDVLRTAVIQLEGSADVVLYLVRKLGVCVCFAASPPGQVCLDSETRLVESFCLAAVTEELKCLLNKENEI